ncbi:hypothetical protein FRC08_000483 [Ceratobasidium sp. 394]|nr:hypothetical protein FRC08_000483 [Ceratobasidium sp. 394]KAG9095931.1 hypothetical protein FS749_009459 [Ceratobasidium sp. UAMH 11750]
MQASRRAAGLGTAGAEGGQSWGQRRLVVSATDARRPLIRRSGGDPGQQTQAHIAYWLGPTRTGIIRSFVRLKLHTDPATTHNRPPARSAIPQVQAHFPTLTLSPRPAPAPLTAKPRAHADIGISSSHPPATYPAGPVAPINVNSSARVHVRLHSNGWPPLSHPPAGNCLTA